MSATAGQVIVDFEHSLEQLRPLLVPVFIPKSAAAAVVL